MILAYIAVPDLDRSKAWDFKQTNLTHTLSAVNMQLEQEGDVW